MVIAQGTQNATAEITYRQALDAIAEKLATVDGVGKVAKFVRWAIFPEKQEEIARDEEESRINYWEITRTAVASLPDDTIPIYRTDHEFAIFGHYGMKDDNESELTFQETIENVRREFRLDNRLNGVLLVPAFIQFPTIGHRKLGPWTVHFCEGRLRVRFREIDQGVI